MRLARLPRFAAAALLSSLTAAAQTYYWSAFAGLPPQFGSADGAATQARFFSPGGVIESTAGIIYVCDSSNFTVRRIGPDGVVSTLAGAPGQRGASDGSAGSARFGYPTGITIANGALFVTDRTNHVIRRISGSGIVTTFAGRMGVAGANDGSAANARFNSPSGIDTDTSGNLYVADSDNHVIRKITPDGEVSTLAGLAGTAGSADGSAANARFNRPRGVYITSAGHVYVADSYNHTVRRIAADGTVTTMAGSPGVQGAANGTGAAARFRFPNGIVAFSNGSVFVLDQTHALRQITADGVVTTFAGRLDVQGSRDGDRLDARFYYPLGLAFASDGVLVADSYNHSIRKVATASGTVTTVAGSPGNFGREDGIGPQARFNFPNGVAIHGSGDVYLADSRGNSIRRISPGGEVVRVAGAATGDAYLDGPAGANSLNYPHGLAVAPDRTVYFCEYQRHTIRVLRPDGSVSTLAGREGVPGATDGSGDAARFAFPTGIALDPEGNLYIADSNNHLIRKIAAGTNTVSTLAGFALVSGSQDGRGTAARFRFPRGIATDSAGNVYVADTSNHTIRRITPSGDVSTLAGAAETEGSANGARSVARFSLPFALTVDAQGTIFVAETGSELLRRIAGDNVTTIGGIAGAQGYFDGPGTATIFFNPSGIAVDATGNLYVSEAGNNVVRRGELMTRPNIATQPNSLAIPAGGSGTLSVAATGGGLTYQWRFNGVPISGATNAHYTVTNLSAALTGDYSVTISNALGSATSQSATVTIGSATAAGRIVNLSILTTLAAPGDNFTMGFVVGGSGTQGSKPLVIRAAGPSLGALGVADTLADPKFDLFAGSTAAGGNDNWGGAATLATAMNSVGAFAYVSSSSRDAAAAADFPSGNNSVAVSAVGNGTGAVIAEIYDATPAASFSATTPRLVNVSVLKHLGAGLTAGFTIGGQAAKNILVRAIGPTLGGAPFNVDGTVADPQLTLFANSGPIGSNDNWGGTPALTAAFAQVGAFQLTSTSRDAAILATLLPGNYTVQVSGVGGTTGLALVEIYEVP